MAKFHWYKRDPDAALNGMAMLTLEERGAYNGIIDLLYSRDGDVPDNDKLVGNVLRVNPRTWRAIKKRLIGHGKVWIEDGKIHAKRIDSTLKEARNFAEMQSNRSRKRWENSENINKNNETRMRGGNPNTTTTRVTERTVNSDTESLIVKPLPLSAPPLKKINGFHNGVNGNGMTQLDADAFAVEKAIPFLPGADIGERWAVAMAAEDATAPNHHKAVTAMLKATKAAGVGWVSPERRKRSAQA